MIKPEKYGHLHLVYYPQYLLKNINHPWLFKLGGWNKHPVYQVLKFILGCRFTFKACAKNVREKTTKYSLKTVEAVLYADGYVFT